MLAVRNGAHETRTWEGEKEQVIHREFSCVCVCFV